MIALFVGVPLLLLLMLAYVLLAGSFRRSVDRLYDVPEDMKRAGQEEARPFNPGPNTWFPQS